MKYAILLASIALFAQENIFLYGDGVKTVTVHNLQPGANGVGVDFKSSDTVTQNLFVAGRVYARFDTNQFSAGRVTIATPGTTGAMVDALTAKNGKVGVGTASPQEKLEVAGVVKADGFKVGAQAGVTLYCPNGITIKQISGGIITDAACNP